MEKLNHTEAKIIEVLDTFVALQEEVLSQMALKR